MEKDFKKYLEDQKKHIEEATKLVTDSNINVDDRANNLLLISMFDLQKQLEQLESKKDSVGKDKYNALKATFEELREDRTIINKQLEAIKKDNKKLVEELEQTKEKLFDMMPSKSSQRIKEYKSRIQELEKLNISLQEEVSSLEKVKTQMLDSVDMVSKTDYDGLIAQMKRETLVAEQYKRLYEEESKKIVNLTAYYKSDKGNESLTARYKELERKYSILTAEHEGLTTRFQGEINVRKQYQKEYEEMKEHFKSDNKSESSEELEQLKQKLSRKGTKWNREEGKGEQDVIAMKAEGKTFKEITALTGMSSATIAKILKDGKSEI